MIRYLTAGESHGQALVGIIEGMPAGLPITAEYINHQLWRRQQGYGRSGRMKIETDKVDILSGVRFGKTLGSPIALVLRNRDWENWKIAMAVDRAAKGIQKVTSPRPGHADYVGKVKYDFDDIRNVIERASARETAMRVACCSMPRRLLEELGIHIASHVLSIGSAAYTGRKSLDKKIKKFLASGAIGLDELNAAADASEVRILEELIEKKAIQLIKRAKKSGDTVGGIIEVIIGGLPVGLGSHVEYDRKLDGQLAGALMSVHAIKGVEIGEGFANAGRYGSDVHDEFILDSKGNIIRPTNRAGGLEGGVTNGEPIILRGAMKPIATLMKPLRTVDLATMKKTEARRERSDFCAVPAASVIGEAVVAPVIANAFLEKFGGDSLGEIKKRYKRK
ncbi:MAG: chorismate synthase [Bacteroidota bacterium]